MATAPGRWCWTSANLGQVSEAELADGLAELYGLDREATGELLADLWDWYAGELNTEMAEYLRGLRPRYRTAIRPGHRRRPGLPAAEGPALRNRLRGWLGSPGFAPRGAEVGSSCIGGPCDGFGAP